MITVHRHNPVLLNKLLIQARQETPQALLSLLQSLSVSESRTAGYLLAERVLPTFEADRYWAFFLAIVPTHSRAYLGTFLKAAVKLYKEDRLPLNDEVLTLFAAQASPIDVRKTLESLLGVSRTTAEVEMLIRIFCHSELESAAPHLLKTGTPQAYYVLFQLLKTVEAHPEILRHHAILLIRKGDTLSYNLASIIRQYFDLADLPGTFSLRMEPYELSRLEQGPEVFLKLLKGM